MASGGDDLSLSQTPLQQLNQLIAKVFDEESINLELNDWAIVDLLRQVSAEECIQLVNSVTTAQGNDSLLHRAAIANNKMVLINAIIEQLSLDQWFQLLMSFADKSPIHVAAAAEQPDAINAMLGPLSAQQTQEVISLFDVNGRQALDVVPEHAPAVRTMLWRAWRDSLQSKR